VKEVELGISSLQGNQFLSAVFWEIFYFPGTPTTAITTTTTTTAAAAAASAKEREENFSFVMTQFCLTKSPRQRST
jgi:hypothetical protein